MTKHFLAVALCLAAVAGCRSERPSSAGDAPPTAVSAAAQPIVVYSGRNEKLIQPLIDRFTRETGIKARVRYGETAEMAATILEEGARTPADVFLSQDAAALGAVSRAGLFRQLPGEITSRIDRRFVGPGDHWVGVSGRARTFVYDPGRIAEDQLPQNLRELTDRRFRRRFGLAPTNASLQAQLAVFHAMEGAEELSRLLSGIVANQPKRYGRNSAIVDAVIAGEIDFGLVNHYYTQQALKERPNAPVRNYFVPAGGAATFMNVAGAGVLSDKPEARRFVEYLLADGAQLYFAGETREYALVENVPAGPDLPPLKALNLPDIDWGAVAAVLPQTLEAIRRSGLLEQ
jgi:iron(III) transport system substrate-binding protein